MPPRPSGPQYVLTLSCADGPGLVHAVAGFLVDFGGNIVSSQQYGDRETGRFFMRVEFDFVGTVPSLPELEEAFRPVAAERGMTFTLADSARPLRTLILVSKFGHCLNDLLYRHRMGTLNIEIPLVISNHPDFADLVSSAGIPYVHLPVTPETKPEAEAEMLRLVAEHDVELVVLARYMQVLTGPTCNALAGRAINIHHSFLPSFKGARPYHQAHERGTKLIGATAHYVNDDLDEGPIIEQDVVRVDHQMSPEDFVAAGRDVETQVLSRAVRWHSEHRVMLNDTRTVVFR